MSAAWEQARIAVQKTGEKILQKRLVAGTWGNISTLIASGGPVAITPSALPYDELNPEDVVIVALNGDIIAGKRPSSELALHLAIYSARPDINAIIHTHSTYACACAVAGKSIPPSLEEVVAAVGGEIRVAEYGFPGTTELASNAVRAMGDRNAVILANHGVVACGHSLAEALLIAELVEKAAQIFVIAESIGGAKSLHSDDVNRMHQYYKKSYRRD